MERGEYLDLVIGGPDMSGTSTQIKNTINFFKTNGLKVRDLRGTETDALFHAKKFLEINQNKQYLLDLDENERKDFLLETYYLMSGRRTNEDLKIASCVENDVSTYVDPNSADVWIMEEPSKRGAGQVCRAIEQNKSEYSSSSDHISVAVTHSVYRMDEFLRFRRQFRDNNKTIIRSRSEESGIYQIYDEDFIPTGITLENYLNLPGHKIAFQNAPTNIFVVCGPEDWTVKDYLKLKEERSGGRRIDDFEKNAPYQVLVNKRYASNWIENFYENGCKMNGGIIPEITKFSIYDSIETIREKMNEKISKILKK